jgi:hypothetical protein
MHFSKKTNIYFKIPSLFITSDCATVQMPDVDLEAQAQEDEILAAVAALGKPGVFADPRIQAAVARLAGHVHEAVSHKDPIGSHPK